MKSKFSTSFLVFLYIFIDGTNPKIEMENVSIDSKWNLFCTVYVSFKYEWTKTTNKNHKNYISTFYDIDCSVTCYMISWCSITCDSLKHVGLKNSKREALKMNKNARLDSNVRTHRVPSWVIFEANTEK